MKTIRVNPQSLDIDPVVRVEGHLRVEVAVDEVDGLQQVVDAKVSGVLFRGFERILAGRSPWDAPDLTQRICGVCPVSHGLAASLALERVNGLRLPPNARWMRNLTLAANYLQSHILHFYVLSLLDFVDGPDMPPWQPSWKSDKRISGDEAKTFVEHYLAALETRRKCHEMGAIFGGKLPHPPAFVAGGFSAVPKAEDVTRFRSYLAEVEKFIHDIYLTDVERVAGAYPDYRVIGGGHKRLLAFGCFDEDSSGAVQLFPRGRSGEDAAVDLSAITEHVAASWYADDTGLPAHPKDNAYSWIKAPRYDGVPYEVGPLARMWVKGLYQDGVSVMDRHLARAKEAAELVPAMRRWLDQIVPGQPVYERFELPAEGAGAGLVEAPRGALGHWVKIAGGKIEHYSVITPTCWNASPRDAGGVRGPMEEALIGTPVKDVAEPVEVVRVLHSFDPCLACAVHAMRPAAGWRGFHAA